MTNWRWCCVAIAVLGFGCGGSSSTANDASFQPKSSGATLDWFRAKTTATLSELDPSAAGYAHVPRSIHLVAPLHQQPSGDFKLTNVSDDAELPADTATLRVLEYGRLPRLYLVTTGHLNIEEQPGDGGAFGHLMLHLDVTLFDVIDNADLHLQGDYAVRIGGSS